MFGESIEGHQYRTPCRFPYMIDSRSLLWQGATIQIPSGRLQFFLRSIQPAFWPAVPLRQGFATGKTLAQGEFTSPEHFNHRRVGRPTGAKPKRKCDLSKQAAFSFGGDGGIRTPGRFDPSTDFESASLRPLRYISMLYSQRSSGFPPLRVNEQDTRHCGRNQGTHQIFLRNRGKRALL